MRRKSVLLVMAPFVIGAVALGIYFVYVGLDESDKLGSVVGALVAVLALGLAVLALRWPQADAGPTAAVDAEADDFAFAIRAELRAEHEARRVDDPAPLTVTWRRARPAVLDAAENTYGTTWFPMMAGPPDVYRWFAQVPRRRAVILGSGGSGKTVLAIRLAVNILDARAPGGPVPVLLNIATWRATGDQSLRDWLHGQLTEKYAALRKVVAPGRDLTTALLDRELIVPILDGFDELTPDQYAGALAGLNRSTTMPLVLTSRAAEFEAAVQASDVLSLADGIVIDDVEFADVADYLPRTTRRTGPAGGNMWRETLTAITSTPAAAPVREALKSPLLVFLMRVLCSDRPGRDPLELLDTNRFPTVDSVRSHLLAGYIPAVYDPAGTRWHPDRVRDWLRGIARRCEATGIKEFGWWDIRDTVPRMERMLVFTVVGALAGTILLWPFSPWLGAGMGTGLGLGVSVSGFGPRPSVVQLTAIRYRSMLLTCGAAALGAGVATLLALRFLPPDGYLHRDAVWRIVDQPGSAFAIGFGVAVALGLLDSAGKWWDRRSGQASSPRKPQALRMLGIGTLAALAGAVVFGPASGLLFGSLSGIGAGVVASLEGTPDVSQVPSTASSLHTDRISTLAKLVGFGTLVGVVFGLFSAPAGWVVWLSLGVSAGLANGAAVAFGMNAWGHWIVVTRFWMTVTRRLPPDVVEFLQDARDRGVLRQVGGVYQFRHATLQEALAE